MMYSKISNKRNTKLKFFRIIMPFIGILTVLIIIVWSAFSVRAQQSTPAPNQNPSPEAKGTRHVQDYRLIHLSGVLDGLKAMFGNDNEGGYFRNRMGDEIAPELIDYYGTYMLLDALNLPKDTRQQYLLDMQQSGVMDSSDDDWRLSNIDREKCYDNPFEDFFSECVVKGTQAQTQKIYQTSHAAISGYTDNYEKVARDGQGLLGAHAPINKTDIDGESKILGQSVASGAMYAQLMQALFAYVALLQSQHGVPGDVGTDPSSSMPPITPPDTPDFENPSHPGSGNSNPQLPDDFGTGHSNPFDDWSNFDSSPWMDSTQNQLQQTLNDFSDIDEAFECLPASRLAAVVDILGTTEVQNLMRADTENINCLNNKPATAQPIIHQECTVSRKIQPVTDTALILGLLNQYADITKWNVYVWPEELLREYTEENFTPNSCVWIISADNDAGTNASFIGDQDNIGTLEQITTSTE